MLNFTPNRLRRFAARWNEHSRWAPSFWCCIPDRFAAAAGKTAYSVPRWPSSRVSTVWIWRGNLRVLIENTAGSEFSLGGNFEQVAELLYLLSKFVPAGACIDTCHTHVSGYDIVSDAGLADTIDQLERTVGLKNVYVWHCNDAKAERGSKLDRHQHIGKGSIGLKPFRRLLNDARMAHAAFIAETPIDEPLDDLTNVNALKKLVERAGRPIREPL